MALRKGDSNFLACESFAIFWNSLVASWLDYVVFWNVRKTSDVSSSKLENILSNTFLTFYRNMRPEFSLFDENLSKYIPCVRG